jgi:hypothetical protein
MRRVLPDHNKLIRMFTSLWWLHEGQGIMLGIHLHGVSERDYRIHMLSWPCSSQIHQVRLPFFLHTSQPAMM